MKEMAPVRLKEISVLVTREKTIIDFETPQVNGRRVRVTLEQFVLEYDPSSVIVASGSSQMLLWQAVWLHEFEKPPYDFALYKYSRN